MPALPEKNSDQYRGWEGEEISQHNEDQEFHDDALEMSRTGDGWNDYCRLVFPWLRQEE